MNRWAHAIGATGIFLLFAAFAASCGDRDSNAATTRSLPTTLTEQRNATRQLFAAIDADQPGCSIAVGRGDVVVFAEAYGAASLAPATPNTPETVMDIGSTSKQFTAYAVLLLVDDGRLALDDDVRRYVPELPEYGAPVTLRQMLHHQSGIPDYVGLLADRISTRTTARDALIALQSSPKLEFSPGTRFAYSNSNYFLFSQVVERTSGVPLPVFLRQRVFGPAGMKAVMDPVAAVPRKALSYRRVGAGWENADSRWEQVGDGGIQTTPTQLVEWASQYWTPTVGSPRAQRGRLEGAVPVGPGGRFGAGIVQVELPDGTQVLTHDGAWAGFTTSFLVVPSDQLAIAVTCNGAVDSGIDAQRLLEVWHR